MTGAPPAREIVLETCETMSPTVRGFTFRVAAGSVFEFEPGQWVSMILPTEDARLIRAYSIASPPRGDSTFDLAVTHVPDGPASDFMYGLAPGERLRMTGPFGTFRLREPIDRPVTFVATGTGVAPFRSMLHELLEKRRVRVALTLVLGVRTPNDILFRREFEAWEKRHSNFTFVPTLSRPGEGWAGSTGYVQGVCERLLRPWREADIYVCGVRKMVDDVRARLREWGYARSQVHYERYD
jgi:CDP-4-dehydro-6-deoxyglucose reductase